MIRRPPKGAGRPRRGLTTLVRPAVGLRWAGTRGTQIILGVLVIAVMGAWTVHAARPAPKPRPKADLFRAKFPDDRRLITNEVAYFDPKAGAPVDKDWLVTSGSLFSDGGNGWTGPVDSADPDPQSRVHTNSAIFRLVTRRHDFGNVTVRFDLDVAGLTSTAKTPKQSYDGVHVFLRYSSAQQLYAASVFRRDGEVAIKKKVPGGPVNGGEYATLASVRHDVPIRRWNAVAVSVANTQGGVRLTVTINGQLVLQALDKGTLGATLTAPGQVGIRGDNTNFRFRGFRVTQA